LKVLVAEDPFSNNPSRTPSIPMPLKRACRKAGPNAF
jgi:hypothetical protein